MRRHDAEVEDDDEIGPAEVGTAEDEDEDEEEEEDEEVGMMRETTGVERMVTALGAVVVAAAVMADDADAIAAVLGCAVDETDKAAVEGADNADADDDSGALLVAVVTVVVVEGAAAAINIEARESDDADDDNDDDDEEAST